MGTVSPGQFTSDTETVTRAKLNLLVSALAAEFNGNIDNDNIKAAAGIDATKLDLSSVAQNLTISGELVSTESSTAACLVATNTGDGPHIRFTGDPTVASPTDGDLWFDGTNLYFRIGSTSYTIDMTSV